VDRQEGGQERALDGTRPLELISSGWPPVASAGHSLQVQLSPARSRRPRPRGVAEGLPPTPRELKLPTAPWPWGCSAIAGRAARPGCRAAGLALPPAAARIEPLLVGDASHRCAHGASMAEVALTGAGPTGPPIPGLRNGVPGETKAAAAVAGGSKRARWELSIARHRPCPCDGRPIVPVDLTPSRGDDGEGSGLRTHR